MTNFQAQPPSRFGITPERLVLVLPALAGGLVAAGLALAWAVALEPLATNISQ